MARSYHVFTNCTNTASATNGFLNLISSATVQPSVFEINSGCDATPANQAVKYNFTKFTNVGTNQGAITPVQINPAAGTAIVAVTTAGTSSSVLATYSGVLLQWAQNQNTAYRWVASGPTRTLQLPSTALAGGGFLPIVVTSAFNAVFGVFFEE